MDYHRGLEVVRRGARGSCKVVRRTAICVRKIDNLQHQNAADTIDAALHNQILMFCQAKRNPPVPNSNGS